MKAFDSGPVFYFDEVKRRKTRIVANVCGTRQRICYALEANVENLYRKLIAAWRSNFFVTSPLILTNIFESVNGFSTIMIFLRNKGSK